MKKLIRISALIVIALMAFSLPAQAHGGGHGGWGWGPALGLGLLGLGVWELSQPRYYSYPAPVVQEPQEEIYLQPAPQEPAATAYWYYCRNPEGYYPYVKQCPDGWMKVVPAPPQQ